MFTITIYETVKASVTAREAAERYGLTVSQSGMACCIFHDDRHPSMKLDERYYCFGCQATGDAIDLTAKLFSVSPYDAARKLAADFGLSDERPSVITKLKTPLPDRTEERQCLKLLTDCSRLLCTWKTEYAPRSPDKPPDDRFIAACHWESYIDYLLDYLAELSPEDKKTAVRSLMSDGTMNRIKKIMEETNGRTEKRHEYDPAI